MFLHRLAGRIPAHRGTRILAVSALAAVATLSCGLTGQANAKTGAVGWQQKLVYNLPTGAGGVFLHYPCPAAAPIARSGGFSPNNAAVTGLLLVGEGPRL